jgi:biopolymer transport protein ExbB
MNVLESFLAQAQPPGAAPGLGSLFDVIVSGGPVMIPIGICSVVALTFAVDRWLRLRPHRLGTKGFGKELVTAVREGGATSGIVLCEQRQTPLARILAVALRHAEDPLADRDRAVEDAGAKEVRRLSQSLRPLAVIAMLAPLLGLFGTVCGIILGFAAVANLDAQGNPQMLARAVSHALVTTASGLVIAIAAQTLYFYFRSRVDRFVHSTEDLYAEVVGVLGTRASSHAHP